MSDQFEMLLSSRLRGAPLPAAPAALSAYVRQVARPMPVARPAWRPSPLLLAATLGALLATMLGLLALGGLPKPTPQPTPIDTEGLLRDFPSVEVLFAHSVGEPDSPISDDRRRETTPVFSGAVHGPFVVAASCMGPTSAEVQVRQRGGVVAEPTDGAAEPQPTDGVPRPSAGTPGQSEAFFNATVVCDGDVHVQEYQHDTAWAEGPQTVTVTAARGSSWRVALGTYPEQYRQPPASFGRLTPTAGWTPLHDLLPWTVATSVSPTGTQLLAPPDATRMGIVAWCSGEAALALSVEGAGPTYEQSVSCPTGPTGTRIEAPIEGGNRASIWARPDGPVWVRLLIEVDAEYSFVYEPAPPLPDGMAELPYAAAHGMGSEQGWLAVGRLGGSRQSLLAVPGIQQAYASGNTILAHVTREGGSALLAGTVEPPALDRTLVETSESRHIMAAWLDARGRRAYYAVFNQTDIEYWRINLDGTGDTLLATQDADSTRNGAALTADGTAFVIEHCSNGQCRRTIVDTATGGTSSVELVARKGSWCSVVGAGAGHVVNRCGDDRGAALVVGALEQASETEILRADYVDVSLVMAEEGPVLLYSLPTTPDGGSWQAMGIDGGEPRSLVEWGPVGPVRTVASVELPPGWVLLADTLADTPMSGNMLVPVPLLVNVVTGEVIEMVNLPHRAGLNEVEPVPGASEGD